MHIKAFIIGFFLLCIGAGTLWWVNFDRERQEQEIEKLKLKYGSETSDYVKRYEEWTCMPPEERSELPKGLHLNDDSKTREEILQEQEERLKADMDKLAAGQMTGYPFTDEFYGSNWQQKIELYKKQKEKREFLFNASIACTTTGGLLTGWMLILGISRVLIKITARIKKSVLSKNKDQELDGEESNEEEENKDSDNKAVSDDKTELRPQEERARNLSTILMNSGWQYGGSFGADQNPVPRQRKRIPVKNRSQNENGNKVQTAVKDKGTTQGSGENRTARSGDKTKSETVLKNNVDVSNTKGHSLLIDTTLKDLTQQVSAIREYAANQQNRLERFQDGYDWNIIKTFCLRIIRCIDNIENRIDQLSEEDEQSTHLEEVRDELVFALESSGIEQFEPKVNSEYRGQEKFAEAVKERTECEEPDKKGKIESVLKPGYQFYIDDQNVKIVRPAQVRLFA
ncbi:MAG: nucleotide exchange factor GrpE [Sedimentisphaerales bacterium]